MEKARKTHKTQKWLVTVAVFAGILLIGATAWALASRPTVTPQSEASELRKRINKLVMLPNGEDPAIATVTDKTVLSDPFLKQAKAGDKLLLYYKSLKVYLYRPSINKVVDIGPITVDPTSAEIKGTRILVKGGAADSTKADAYRARLTTLYRNAVVLSAQDDKANTLESTIVVDLTDNNQKYNLVSNIAATLNIKRGTLPLGETPPAHTDVLIIVGRN